MVGLIPTNFIGFVKKKICLTYEKQQDIYFLV